MRTGAPSPGVRTSATAPDTPEMGEPRRMLSFRAASASIVGVAAVVASAAILHAARGTSFYFDEWWFITRRRDASFDDFMRPNVGHLIAVPVAVYKFFFETFGLGSYRPYLVVLVALHVATCVLLYVYLRRRAHVLYAVVATIVLLFLGYAWQDLAWAFQMTYLFSTVGGLGALLLLDRRDRRGDVGAMLAIAFAIASGGVGLVFAAGALVELAWTRASWRRLWVPVAPLLLFAVWYVAYGDSEGQLDNLTRAPQFITDAAGSAAGAIVGTTVGFGRVVAAVLAIVIIVGVVRAWPISARFAAAVAMLGGFWVLLSYSRASGVHSSGSESRYAYIGALLLLLAGGELLRTRPWPRRVPAWLAVAGGVVLLAALTHTVWANLDALENGAAALRTAATIDKARYSALVLAQPHAGRDVVLTFTGIRSGELLPAIEELDYTVFTRDELLARPEWQRVWADNTLLAVLGAKLRAYDPGRPIADVLRVSGIDGAELARDGGCATVTPTGGAGKLSLDGDAVALRIEALGDAPVDVTARSVADVFHDPPFGQVSPGATRMLVLRPSNIAPWTVRLSSSGPMRVCGLA